MFGSFSKQQILLAILAMIAIVYVMYMYKNKEQFSDETRSNECSQKAINEAYMTWIFGSPQYIR